MLVKTPGDCAADAESVAKATQDLIEQFSSGNLDVF